MDVCFWDFKGNHIECYNLSLDLHTTLKVISHFVIGMKLLWTAYIADIAIIICTSSYFNTLKYNIHLNYIQIFSLYFTDNTVDVIYQN
jgi:hypothetical protein